MKKKSFFLKISIVLLIVTSLLSFTKNNYFLGTIYCFSDAYVSYVNQNTYCDAGIQPHSTKIDYEISFSYLDPTDNPCPFGQTPFDGSYYGLCTQTTPGYNHYRQTPALQ